METNSSVELNKEGVFFKYFSNDEQLLEGLFNDEVIRLTQPWALNDPLEFNPRIIIEDVDYSLHHEYIFDGVHYPSVEDYLKYKLIEPNINEYGILSLTKNAKSFDMWNLYSNAHRGFLVEFEDDFNKLEPFKKTDQEVREIKEVDYVEEYNIVLDKIQRDGDIYYDDLVNELFFKKTDRWEHENEYRMIRPLKEAQNYSQKNKINHRDNGVYLFDFSLDLIDSIAFGAHMSTEDKKFILEKCDGRNITFLQSTIIRNQKDSDGKSGSVSYLEFENRFMSKDKLVNILPQEFTINKESLTEHEKIEVNSLVDIPYFQNRKSEAIATHFKFKEQKS